MNQCHFLGNLVRDPDLRTTQSGKSVVNVTIAVNRRYKKAGQNVNEAAFLNCEAWDSGADLISKYFKKGDPIIIHCSVKQEEWQDAEGKKRTALKFRINEFEFIPNGKKNNGDSASTDDAKEPTKAKKSEPEPVAAGKDDDDNIPF